MSSAAPLQKLAAKPQPSSNSTHAGSPLKRKCACGSPTSRRPLEPELRQDMAQRFGHDFSRMRVHSGAAAEQASPGQTQPPPRESLQPTPMHCESPSPNRLPRGVQDVIRSPGQPLDPTIGAAVAPYLESISRHARPSHTSAAHEHGHEREADRVAKATESAPASAKSSHHEDSAMFRTVRIHTDARAAESAREVAARAYTVGDHVAFAAGRFQPHTQAGRSLLAHELTHVVQGRSAGSQFANAAPPLLRSPDPTLEAQYARIQAREELREGWHSDIAATSEAYYQQFVQQQKRVGGSPYFWIVPNNLVLVPNLELGFATGFMTALSKWVDPLDIIEYERSMREHPIKFGAGYLAGIITGVGRDLVWNLVGLVDLAKLAFLLTPAGMAYLGSKESQKWAEDPAARAALYKSVISALWEFQKYIETDPTALLPQGRELGFMAGDALGEYARHMVLDEKDPYSKGVAVGYPVGIIALEILLLFISWEKYALRGVTAAGKGMQVAGRRAALLLKDSAYGRRILNIIETTPGLRDLVVAAQKAETVAAKTGQTLVEKTGSAAEKALDATPEYIRNIEQRGIPLEDIGSPSDVPPLESAVETITEATKAHDPKLARRKPSTVPLPQKSRTEKSLKSLTYQKPRPRKGYYTGAKPPLFTPLDYVRSLSQPELHHFWPEYLGGLPKQSLGELSGMAHDDLHTSLIRWKGGIFNYQRRGAGPRPYEQMKPEDVFKELREFYEKADQGRWRESMPNFEKAAEETLTKMGKWPPK